MAVISMINYRSLCSDTKSKISYELNVILLLKVVEYAVTSVDSNGYDKVR